MRLPASKVIIFNAAAGLVGVAALVAAVRSVLVPETVTPCSERYLAMTSFALERGGVTLTAADLQASLGGTDVGVIENVAIDAVKGAPAPLAMGVRLQRNSGAGGSADAKGGTTFPWAPRALQAKSSACLTFNVLFPAGFDFQRGGALPGIRGANANEPAEGFLARLAWRAKAAGGATILVNESGSTRALPAEREAFQFPTGKWVKLEQEVLLNTPKKSDGTLRVWVDGTLAIERTDIAYRAKPDVAISGVSVDVFLGASPDDPQAASAKDSRVWLTPFEVRWH
jgi:hypothetical protein